MLAVLGEQLLHAQGQAGRVGRAGERALGVLFAQVARERHPGAGEHALLLLEAILRGVDRALHRQPFGPAGPAALDPRGEGGLVEARCGEGFVEHLEYLACVVGLEPREPCLAGQFQTGAGQHGGVERPRALGTRLAQAALLRIRELLHHADAAHGHGVGLVVPGVGAADRQVVDAEGELRVGQGGGAAGGSARGVEAGALRGHAR